MSSWTSTSASRVMLWDIIIADPRSPLISKETSGFVNVESLHVIP